LGSELFALADVLDSSAQLRRTVTDANVAAEAKAGLVRSLFAERVSPAALEVLTDLARARWSRSRDVPDALEELGVRAVVAQADADAVLDLVEDELFRFSRIIQGNPALYAAFTDRAASREARFSLVDSLLGGKANLHTIALAKQALARPSGRRIEDALDDIVHTIAAGQRRSVAVVTSAVPLSPAQHTRLAEALSRIYHRHIDVKVDHDPHLVGGLRIEVGDEVIDGSVLARLDDAERRMAG
jgi:F-type H+-transporting ATPase subunit delta